MLIRYGGDEFLLILPDMKETEFLKKLKKIKTDLVQTSIPGYSRIQQSVSIGGVLTGEESIESGGKTCGSADVSGKEPEKYDCDGKHHL